MGNAPGQPARKQNESRNPIVQSSEPTVPQIQYSHENPRTSTAVAASPRGENNSMGRNHRTKSKLRKKKISSTPPPRQQSNVSTATSSGNESTPGYQNAKSREKPENVASKESREEQRQKQLPGTVKPVKKERRKKSSGKNRTKEDGTIEKDATVEKDLATADKTVDVPAVAKRKRQKVSGSKVKEENTEFERVKAKARPATQKKNSHAAGTRNLEKMMSVANTASTDTAEPSLKSFDDDDEENLKTARMDLVEQQSLDNQQTREDKPPPPPLSADKPGESKSKDSVPSKNSEYVIPEFK